MDKFLDMLAAYDAWLDESAVRIGLPVDIVKPLIELEVAQGVCEICLSKDSCPAREYLLARDKPVPGAPENS